MTSRCQDLELVICDLDEGFVSAARECFREESGVCVVQDAMENFLRSTDRMGTCVVHPTNTAGLLASNLDRALTTFLGPTYAKIYQQYTQCGEKDVGSCHVLHTPMLEHVSAVALAVVYPYSPGIGGGALAQLLHEVTRYNGAVTFSGAHSDRITRIVTPGLGTFVGNTHFAETARDMARAWSNFRHSSRECEVSDAGYTAGPTMGKGKGKLR